MTLCTILVPILPTSNDYFSDRLLAFFPTCSGGRPGDFGSLFWRERQRPSARPLFATLPRVILAGTGIFLDLARCYLHHADGVADHVSGTLLAFSSFGHALSIANSGSSSNSENWFGNFKLRHYHVPRLLAPMADFCLSSKRRHPNGEIVSGQPCQRLAALFIWCDSLI